MKGLFVLFLFLSPSRRFILCLYIRDCGRGKEMVGKTKETQLGLGWVSPLVTVLYSKLHFFGAFLHLSVSSNRNHWRETKCGVLKMKWEILLKRLESVFVNWIGFCIKKNSLLWENEDALQLLLNNSKMEEGRNSVGPSFFFGHTWTLTRRASSNQPLIKVEK